MSSRVIIAIIFLALLLGGFLYLYFVVEKNNVSEYLELVNITISTKEGTNFIETGYNIYVDNFFYSTGVTSSKSAVLISVPFNASIKITNKNIENQTYYDDFIEFFSSELRIYRVELFLVKPLPLIISQRNSINDDNVKVDIKSKEFFKEMVVCLRWSSDILYADISNYTEIDDDTLGPKCYMIGDVIGDLTFDIKIRKFNYLGKEDYVELTFYNYLTNDVTGEKTIFKRDKINLIKM